MQCLQTKRGKQLFIGRLIMLMEQQQRHYQLVVIVVCVVVIVIVVIVVFLKELAPAAINLKDNEERTALHLAVAAGNVAVIETLVSIVLVLC